MWFLKRKREPSRTHNSRTRCCCAYRGAHNEHDTGTCIVTVQYGDEDEMCMVYLADYPPQGNCKSVIDAKVLANNVREENAGSHTVGSHRRVYGG